MVILVLLHYYIIIIIYLLSLLEPPSAPVITDIIVSGSRTVNISWQDGISPIPGNPPVNAYQVSLNNSLISSVSATSVILNTLLPFINYIVTITAMNRIGISNSSEPVLFMTDEERMFNIYYSVITHSSYVLRQHIILLI